MNEKIRNRIINRRKEMIMIVLIIVGVIFIKNGICDLFGLVSKLFGYTKFWIHGEDLVASNPIFGMKEYDMYSIDIDLIKRYISTLIKGIVIFGIGYANSTRRIIFKLEKR